MRKMMLCLLLVVLVSRVCADSLDDQVVIGLDELFLDFFLDPFATVGATADEQGLPPRIIYEKGTVTKEWKDSQVTIPEHLDFFAFDLFQEQDENTTLKIRAIPSNRAVIKDATVTITDGTKVRVDIDCQTRGRSTIVINVNGNIVFPVIKDCAPSTLHGLLVSSQKGSIAFSKGKVTSSFNVHDMRGESFIASKEDQTDDLYFHTLEGVFVIDEVPIVTAYAPTESLLSWIAKSSPMLNKELKKVKKEGSAEQDEEAFYEENDDEDEDDGDYEDDDDDDDDDDDEQDDEVQPDIVDPEGGQDDEEDEEQEEDKKDASSLEKPIPNELVIGSKDVSNPTLAGAIFEGTKRKRKVRIVHRKDVGEKKLLGFAQAGVLGMHGGKRLQINYNCVNDGLAVIVVRVKVKRGFGGDVVRGQFTPMVGSEELTFSWLKVCSAEQIAKGEIDLMGVDVNLGMYAKEENAFFPIMNGIATTPFAWTTHSVIASPEELTTSFYISLREEVEEERLKRGEKQLIRVKSVRIWGKRKSNDIINPKLSGHGSHGGVLTSEALPVTIHYNCKRSGTTRLGLDILVDVVTKNGEDEDPSAFQVVGNGKERRLSFYWQKECAVTPITVLNALTMDPIAFEPLKKNASDLKKFIPRKVISDGETDPLFVSSGDGNEMDFSTLFSLPSTQDTFALQLFKMERVNRAFDRKRKHVGLKFLEPIVTSSSTCVEVSLRNIGEMEEMANLGREEYMNFITKNLLSPHKAKLIHGDDDDDDDDHDDDEEEDEEEQGIFELTEEDPLYLVVDHVCRNSGQGIITLTLPLYGIQKTHISIKWVKQCSWSETALSASQTGGAVIFFVVIAILVTSSVFCVMLHKQREKIQYLESKDKKGFTKMSVISSI